MFSPSESSKASPWVSKVLCLCVFHGRVVSIQINAPMTAPQQSGDCGMTHCTKCFYIPLAIRMCALGFKKIYTDIHRPKPTHTNSPLCSILTLLIPTAQMRLCV